uniref:Uncharacterized protein n=1 Tax=Roseihalotalea indica TaxID=2867963 RepID=A0AA49GHW5_9BACT|nr:hypothetical protein K4G66_22420 [Tunicatimonas sp. TK19036]
MALTDHSDVFASFHEDGFNRIIEHIMQQRPSLFNYGTPDLVQNPQQLCQKINAHPAVEKAQNPLIKQIDYLPIIGYDGPFGFSFGLQLTDFKIDFHPSNVIGLPPQLNPPLKEQELALTAQACAGLGCPDPEFIERLISILPDPKQDERERPDDEPRKPLSPMPFRGLTCFCLEVFGVVKAVQQNGYLSLRLQGLEIKDILPAGLEDSIECYISTMLKLAILPKVRIALEDLIFELTDFLSVGPTPISADVPFNPNVSQDQIAVFADLI